MASPEGSDEQSCHICGKFVGDMEKHIWAEHGEAVACQLCDQKFPVGNLRWHILKEHCQDKIVECSLCGKKFTTKNALQGHIRQIHLSEASICNICNQECDNLQEHVNSSHKEEAFGMSLLQ